MKIYTPPPNSDSLPRIAVKAIEFEPVGKTLNNFKKAEQSRSFYNKILNILNKINIFKKLTKTKQAQLPEDVRFVHIGDKSALDHDVFIGGPSQGGDPHIGGGINEDLECLL